MRHAVLALVALSVLASRIAPDPAPLRGLHGESIAVERDWETTFRAIPDPQRMRAMMQRLSARPHHVGSPYDKANAEWIRDQFKSYGWDTHIETFDVLFPTPKTRVVELVAPTQLHARSCRSRPFAGDPTSGQHDEQLPTYNAYSIDGDVTGAARLRQLRHTRRLRRARAPRHLREGRDRHRALRRLVARHQAEGRGRARRGRLPHLLRSARRRLRRRRRLPERSDASARRACSAAASRTCRSIPAIR